MKKISPVKPKDFRKRFGDSQSVPEKETFTFFETLSDASMEKFVGLDGEIHSPPTRVSAPHPPEPKDLSDEKTMSRPPAPASEDLKTQTASVEAAPPPSISIVRQLEELSSGKVLRFAVQVSSFRDLARAEALKVRLEKKGYPVFLTTADLPGRGGEWHRVLLGRYGDWETANRAAQKARDEEKLNAVVIRQGN
ncbi:MAG: SPOR domain-containing protein [Nitrospinaceae bacterium]